MKWDRARSVGWAKEPALAPATCPRGWLWPRGHGARDCGWTEACGTARLCPPYGSIRSGCAVAPMDTLSAPHALPRSFAYFSELDRTWSHSADVSVTLPIALLLQNVSAFGGS